MADECESGGYDYVDRCLADIYTQSMEKLTEKLDPYDILSVLVPGLLLLVWVPICFPQLVTLTPSARLPETVSVVSLLVAALLLGQVNQALASLLQPILYWTWRGKPSDRMQKGEVGNYLSASAARRIRALLKAETDGDESGQVTFEVAMRVANTSGNPRVERFNTAYGYQRNLLNMMITGTVMAAFAIRSRAWQPSDGIWVIMVLLALTTVLFWHRARQRAYYYVREVLLTAEQVLKVKQKDDGNRD